MKLIKSLALLLALAVFSPMALTADHHEGEEKKSSVDPHSRLFEMRTYYANPGKIEELHARFRNHTNAIFVKHGMTLVGYWVPEKKNAEDPDTLVYILAYPSKEARDASWKAFGSDPDWREAFKKSTENGRLVSKVDSVFLKATDYSPIR